jgi:hypothetical protein
MEEKINNNFIGSIDSLESIDSIFNTEYRLIGKKDNLCDKSYLTSFDYNLAPKWFRNRHKNGIEAEQRVGIVLERLEEKIIKRNNLTLPAYYNEHGADFITEHAIIEVTNPRATTHLDKKAMKQKIDCLLAAHKEHPDKEMIMIVSWTYSIGRKICQLINSLNIHLIEMGYTYRRNCRSDGAIFNRKLNCWVEPQRCLWKFDNLSEPVNKDLEKQLIKILYPAIYEKKYAEFDRFDEKRKQADKQEDKEYEGKIKAAKAAIYKAIHTIKKLKITIDKQYLNQKLSRQLQGSDYERRHGRKKIEFLNYILEDYKKIIKSIKPYTMSITKRIRKTKPTETTETTTKETEEKNRMSTHLLSIDRRFLSKYKGKRVYHCGRPCYLPLTKKMSEMELYFLRKEYEPSCREEEIKRDIDILKDFGFTKEEILQSFKRAA